MAFAYTAVGDATIRVEKPHRSTTGDFASIIVGRNDTRIYLSKSEAVKVYDELGALLAAAASATPEGGA